MTNLNEIKPGDIYQLRDSNASSNSVFHLLVANENSCYLYNNTEFVVLEVSESSFRVALVNQPKLIIGWIYNVKPRSLVDWHKRVTIDACIKNHDSA